MRLLNVKPSRGSRILLAGLPFALLAAAYLAFSALRLAANPDDKLLPAVSSMVSAMHDAAFVADPRTGEIQLWIDTLSSLERLFAALAISTSAALVFGLAMGLLPVAGGLLNSFVAVASMVPPLALLPILFITLGLGESSKITLIVVGTLPFLLRDLSTRVAELPREQIVKAQTLGGSTWQIAIRVVLPQMLPRLIDGVRLSLGPAWLFLIAAEAIASDSGLGYRIFLVRRYLAMDTIIPYVAWITLLAVFSDFTLRMLRDRAFPWFADARAS